MSAVNSQQGTVEAVMFRDDDYGAMSISLCSDGIREVNNGLAPDDAGAIRRVLSRYAESVKGKPQHGRTRKQTAKAHGKTSKDRDRKGASRHSREQAGGGRTGQSSDYGYKKSIRKEPVESVIWNITDCHPAVVLSSVVSEMRLRGYEEDPLAERAITHLPIERSDSPDLPVRGKALVHEAIERGIRQKLGLVVAALREHGPASVPSIQFFPRPNAVSVGGRRPPFAIARFFVESTRPAMRGLVLSTLEEWRDHLVKVSVVESGGGKAIEVGIALPGDVCEALMEDAIPTFANSELTGAREVVFTLREALSEDERKDIEELGRVCTGAIHLTQEGTTLTAQVPAGFVGAYVADSALQERLSWLAQVLEPWGPDLQTVGHLGEMNLTPEPNPTELREISRSHRDDIRARHKMFMRGALAKQGTSYGRPIDPDEYPKIPGLEGPFQFRKSGRILYYDPKGEYAGRKGAYYDSKTDLYVDPAMAESVIYEMDGPPAPSDIPPEAVDYGLPPDVNSLVGRFTKIKQHMWDTPQVRTAVKKAKKLVADEHGKDVANKFQTQLDINRATAQESVSENYANLSEAPVPVFGRSNLQPGSDAEKMQQAIADAVGSAADGHMFRLGFRVLVGMGSITVYFAEDPDATPNTNVAFLNDRASTRISIGEFTPEGEAATYTRFGTPGPHNGKFRAEMVGGSPYKLKGVAGYRKFRKKTGRFDMVVRHVASYIKMLSATVEALSEAAYSKAAQKTISSKMSKQYGEDPSNKQSTHKQKIAKAIGVAKAKGQKVPPYKKEGQSHPFDLLGALTERAAEMTGKEKKTLLAAIKIIKRGLRRGTAQSPGHMAALAALRDALHSETTSESLEQALALLFEVSDNPLEQAMLGRTLIKSAGTFKPAAQADVDGSDDEEDKDADTNPPENRKGDSRPADDPGDDDEEDDEDEEKDDTDESIFEDDRRMRELERLAATGDTDAATRLAAMRRRKEDPDSPWLQVGLTKVESLVIWAVGARKAQYGGIKNLRWHYLKDMGFNISLGQYEAARQSLAKKRIFNKAGNATPKSKAMRQKLADVAGVAGYGDGYLSDVLRDYGPDLAAAPAAAPVKPKEELPTLSRRSTEVAYGMAPGYVFVNKQSAYSAFGGRTHYFAPIRQQKNGAWFGVMVTQEDGRRVANKGTKTQVDRRWEREAWKGIPVSETPDKVLRRFKERGIKVV